MHVPYIPQILLPSRRGTDPLFPRMDQFQNPLHNWTWERWWSFWETTDEFVEEFFGGDL